MIEKFLREFGQFQQDPIHFTDKHGEHCAIDIKDLLIEYERWRQLR